MIDLHSHVLPGIDDGAASLEESVEIARAAVTEGVTVLAATPHVRGDFPTSAGTMERAVGEVQAALRDEGVPLELRTGGELAMDFMGQVVEPRRFALGGGNALLLEFPYSGWPLELRDTVFRLCAQRLRPVIAHPERSKDVQRNPERLRPAVEGGALVQLTALSLEGRLGRSARDTGFDLIDRGLAHLVASDAHGFSVRAYGLAGALDAIGDDELGRWLTHDVPAALLEGTRIPERPQRRRRGVRLPFFGRR